MREVQIYTGTNIKSPRAASGRFGYVLATQGKKGLATLEDFGELENVTKNQAELKVVAEALKRMKEPCEITIFTESSYVAAGMEWLEQWKENGWITARGKAVSNKEEWIELSELIKDHKITVECKEHEYSSWIRTEITRRK